MGYQFQEQSAGYPPLSALALIHHLSLANKKTTDDRERSAEERPRRTRIHTDKKAKTREQASPAGHTDRLPSLPFWLFVSSLSFIRVHPGYPWFVLFSLLGVLRGFLACRGKMKQEMPEPVVLASCAGLVLIGLRP
jgi:hypothetical protein